MKRFNLKTAVYSSIVPTISAFIPEIIKLKNELHMNWIFYFIPVLLFVFMYWLISYIQEAKEKNEKLLKQIDEIILAINNHADCLEIKVSRTHEPIEKSSSIVRKIEQINPIKINTNEPYRDSK